MSPKGLTLRRLWWMAAGRRTEERTLLINQKQLIDHTLFGKHGLSTRHIERFLRYGILDAIEVKEPHNPAVDDMVAKVMANGGRLIIEDKSNGR